MVRTCMACTVLPRWLPVKATLGRETRVRAAGGRWRAQWASSTHSRGQGVRMVPSTGQSDHSARGGEQGMREYLSVAGLGEGV